MLLNSAKGRINNYLSSQIPQEKPKMAFDTVHKDKVAEKRYNQAIDLAIQPLSILDHVKNGTLNSDHIKHFKTMYPELNNHLTKELTKKVSESQLNGERLPFKTRQSMSLFLGAPLDSTMKPENIQAAQQVFAQDTQQRQPGQPPSDKNKRGTATLTKVSQNFETADQGRQQRQAKG